MQKYESEIKKLDKAINDLEEKVRIKPDPFLTNMLLRFKKIREKYHKMAKIDTRLFHYL